MARARCVFGLYIGGPPRRLDLAPRNSHSMELEVFDKLSGLTMAEERNRCQTVE
jgi:hypothetical protein